MRYFTTTLLACVVQYVWGQRCGPGTYHDTRTDMCLVEEESPPLPKAVVTKHLPNLNEIYRHNFSWAYCLGSAGSYTTSGLFLSGSSSDRTDTVPDLLYDCNVDSIGNGITYFSFVRGAAGFGLISMLGPSTNYPLETITASFALQGADGEFSKMPKYETAVPAQTNATYVALWTNSPKDKDSGAVRALYAFTTAGDCVSWNGQYRCGIDVAVLDYTVQKAKEQSDGFGWNNGNHH